MTLENSGEVGESEKELLEKPSILVAFTFVKNHASFLLIKIANQTKLQYASNTVCYQPSPSAKSWEGHTVNSCPYQKNSCANNVKFYEPHYPNFRSLAPSLLRALFIHSAYSPLILTAVAKLKL
jgi:hypothetical protein